MDDVKAYWGRMLSFMIEDYRRRNPEDVRGDKELLISLMDHFVQCGTVKKQGERYVLPAVVDTGDFVAPWDTNRN